MTLKEQIDSLVSEDLLKSWIANCLYAKVTLVGHWPDQPEFAVLSLDVSLGDSYGKLSFQSKHFSSTASFPSLLLSVSGAVSRY